MRARPGEAGLSVGSLLTSDMVNCTVVVSVACVSETVIVLDSVTGVLV